MVIGTAQVQLSASWVHSLKEKRTVVKSIVDKVKHRYNVSIAETDTQDYHQTITIGIACVSNDNRHADSMLSDILNFIEDNTEAVVQDIHTELI
jgi:uncharacterized protein YlxP (DUF503 family)